jgi:hypothetical protein
MLVAPISPSRVLMRSVCSPIEEVRRGRVRRKGMSPLRYVARVAPTHMPHLPTRSHLMAVGVTSTQGLRVSTISCMRGRPRRPLSTPRSKPAVRSTSSSPLCSSTLGQGTCGSSRRRRQGRRSREVKGWAWRASGCLRVACSQV